MKKILVVFGTRPEAIKLAPVIRVLKENKNFETIVCSTGQHREMLQQVLRIFDLNVDLDLDMMIPNQTLFDITVNSLKRLDDVLMEVQPDLLIVQGDTTTAFASALSAFYKKIKVAHVEAGLRSYDVLNPFPEEANRRFISVIADYNFTPTQDSADYLLKEGFNAEKIYLTGNTVIDALHVISGKLGNESFASEIKKGIEEKYGVGILQREFILITLHRREKFGGGNDCTS
jgi:UDP-N-acetylglucosamine 2-epimerase (non-hydrolysing)